MNILYLFDIHPYICVCVRTVSEALLGLESAWAGLHFSILDSFCLFCG